MTNLTLTSDLSGLLGRVEEATGPDRELDHALFMMERGDWLLRHGFARDGGDSYWSDVPPVTGANRVSGPEPHTASLDAALGLCERVLPGWCIATIGQQDDRSWWVELREGARSSYSRVADSDARIKFKTPALALTAATLQALIASTASPEGDAS